MFNEAYRGLFLTFAFRYISESHDIKTINVLSSEVELNANKEGFPSSIDEFLEISDVEGQAAMQGAIEVAKKRRLEELQQQS